MTDNEIVKLVERAYRIVRVAVDESYNNTSEIVASPLVAAVFSMLVHDHEPAWSVNA